MDETPLILIVDDDLILQRATVRVLNQAGFRLSQAGDGLTCLQMVRDQRPDLTLLDVNLPDISGVEVCRQIKTDPILAGCFVILLSSERIDSQSQVEGLEGGADGYITRPVTNAELLARVRGTLRIQQAVQALREKEEQLRAIAESSSDHFMRYDKNFRHTYANRIAIEASGLPVEQYIGKTHREMGFPDHLCELWEQNIQKVFATGQRSTVEFAVELAQGTLHLNLILSPEFAVDGSVKSVIGISRDVTERKLAQAHRDRQLAFSTALNEIAQVIISNDNSEDILERSNRIIAETLQLDRALIYDVSFKKNLISGLCEWLKQDQPDITPTKDVYPLDMFLSSLTEIRKTKNYLESHFNAVNQYFIQDGSGKILHEQMKIKSLIWYPFAFDEHGYYVFTLNQILDKRQWTQDDIAFLGSGAKQISLALIKIKLLEEKQASVESLRVSEGKHRLVTQMRQGVAVHEIIMDQAGKPVDYRFLEVNESYERLTGLKRENIIGKTVLEILPNVESDQINKYGQVAMTGEPLQYESYVKELGQYFEVVVYSPQPEQVAVIISDISERRQAEDALKDAFNFRTAIENSMQAGIAAIDMAGNQIAVNPHFSKMVGWTSEELVGKSAPFEYWPPNEIENINDAFQLTMRGKAPQAGFELKFIRKNGELFDVWVNLSALENSKDETIGWLAVVTDITERKQMEAALRIAEAGYRDIFDNATVAIFQSTLQGQFSRVNSFMARVFGYASPEEMTASITDISRQIYVNSDDRRGFQRILAERGEVSGYISKNYRKDHSMIWTQTTARVVKDELGNILYYEGFLTDITERKHAEDSLRESEAMLSQFLRHSPYYAYIKAVTPGECRVLLASENYKEMIGISGRDMVGKTMADLFPPEFATKITADDWAVVSNGEVVTLDEELNGHYYATTKFPIVQADKILLAGYTIDITERKQAEDQLRKLSRAVEHSPASIIITDRDGKIEYVNPKFIALSGYSPEEVRDQTPRILKSGQTHPEVYAELWQTILAGKEWRGELLNRKKNGELYWESASISAITDLQGSITHFVGVQEDISERRAAEEQIRLLNLELEKLALTDFLTNLYNRRYFMQRGEEEFKRSHRNNRPLALLMLDIDEFKKVNDSYGHEAGDLALQQVAAVTKSSLREIDLLGRMGGEEFAALLPNTSLEEAILSAERVRQIIANTPFVTPGQDLSISITISVGVATITDQMSGVGDLLRNADAALYRAKHNGRNCVVDYQEKPG